MGSFCISQLNRCIVTWLTYLNYFIHNKKKVTLTWCITGPLKDFITFLRALCRNPVWCQCVNHVLNIQAYLTSWREINGMNNLYNNPPKMKELSNKSTCATTLIQRFSTMLIRSHTVSPSEICSHRLIITARYAIMGHMYFKSKRLCDREGWQKQKLRWHRRGDWTERSLASSCPSNCNHATLWLLPQRRSFCGWEG